jgi:mRNA interferase RelE/StbE
VSQYDVEFTTAAAKQLRKLDPDLRRRLLAAIGQLAVEPRPAGCRKLVGEQNAWRVRIGDYRVIYDIFDERLLVTVVRAAHRREVY